MSVKFTENILSACYHTLYISRRKVLRSQEHSVWLSSVEYPHPSFTREDLQLLTQSVCMNHSDNGVYFIRNRQTGISETAR